MLETGNMNIWEWIKCKIFGSCKAKFDKFADPTKPFMGYMTVNNWSSKNASDTLEKLVKNNCQCAPFEFFENPLAYADPNVQGRLDKFKKWIDEAKDRKVILYVTLLNCNLGNPKTGHPEITAPKCDKQITAVRNQFAKWMKEYSFIYLTPCGEGGNQSPSYEKNLQNWCKANMPKFQLVNNWGSRPSGTDGMGFFCQHPSGCSSPMTKGAWIMSDHTLFINQLRDYTSTYNCARSLRAKGFTFIYYDFPATDPIDSEALRAINDAQK